MSDTSAPPPIQEAERDGRPAWLLSTRNTAMVLSLGAGDVPLLDHWGATGDSDSAADYLAQPRGGRPSQAGALDGVPLVYPVFGYPTYKEPCLCVVYDDGCRIAQPIWRSARVVDGVAGRLRLEIELVDPAYGLAMTLLFTPYPEYDVIERATRLENRGERPVQVERALSAGLALPPGCYDGWTLQGQWGREFGVQRRRLGPGKLVVESRRGFTSAEANPWFAITPAGEASEHYGPVWFGALAWSGSWFTALEVERNDAVNVVSGIQPFDFSWQLGPGERFETPALACGYARQGLGEASRLLHSFESGEVLPATHRDEPRPVLYNSWEATHFDVRVDKQMELARRAAALGVELFVVDDGWFGARNSDRAGLGDWVVNRDKFPHGLRELADGVHGLGMLFGLWVEPEMVNRDSDLYRAHPDWVLHFAGRERTEFRNQLVLNFAREDVRTNILGQLRAVLRDNAIDFVKWDHNRPYTEVGWPSAPAERQREVWVRHVYGVYEVFAALRGEFPRLLIESCASGGGRADLGILRLTDQVWTSDNTEAADRLFIQYGYSRSHAPRTMVNWVTDVPNQQTGRVSPLEFRFHVAMQGVLGLGGDIARWSAEECAAARSLVDQYKRLRLVIQQGDQYWLIPPSPAGVCAVEYVARDRGTVALLLYQVRGVLGEGARRVHLAGLEPTRRYRREADGATSTGAALMAAGVPAPLVGDWRSELQLWHADS